MNRTAVSQRLRRLWPGGKGCVWLRRSNHLGKSCPCLAGVLTVILVQVKNVLFDRFAAIEDAEIPMDKIGEALVGSEKYQYVLPFEFISLFLLACIIGGLVVSRNQKEDK